MARSSLFATISALLSRFGYAASASTDPPSANHSQPNDSDTDDDLAEMIPENPERPFHWVFSMLHQPDAVLKKRIVSVDSVPEYMKQIQQTIKDYLAIVPEDSGRTGSIILALKPGRPARFWIEYHPEPLPQPVHQELLKKLEALETPAVQHGPVSFAMFGLLWGGIGRENHPHFSIIPKEWLDAGGGVIPDDPLSKVWPD